MNASERKKAALTKVVIEIEKIRQPLRGRGMDKVMTHHRET